MYLVETHKLYKGNPYFKMLDNFCLLSKNLYNNALYHIKQYYYYCKNLEDGKSIENLQVPPEIIDYMKDKGKYINYYGMDKLSKLLNNSLTEDYKAMPYSSCSQQILKKLNMNWQSFFKANKKFKTNPKLFNGSPRPPKYLDKNGRFELILTNQACKLKDNTIYFPKSFNDFKLNTKVDNLKEVRIIPRVNCYKIEIVYEVKEKELLDDNKKYMSIDIGVDNLAAVTMNFNGNQYIISGRPLKAINRFYNDQRDIYRSKLFMSNTKPEQRVKFEKGGKGISISDSKRLKVMREKRNNRIDAYFHKASKMLIELAESYGVSKIIVGHNEGWKQNSKLSNAVNQKFQQIPFNRFISMLIYKGKLKGIEVIEVEESYTSGTSFLDNEMPIKENYNKSRRKSCGLFVSNEGRKLNADINGSYQILKKFIKENYFVTPSNLRRLSVLP